MKFNKYIISTVVLLASCSPNYKLQSYDNQVIEVQADIDSTFLTIIKPYQDRIQDQMNEILCYSKIEMKKGRPESLLGNFVSDLCLNYTDADICVMNNGGLRSTLPKGHITRGDIYTLMPFENELVVLELDEKSFNGLLDYIVLRGGEPFSGMELSSLDGIHNFKISQNLSSNFNDNKKIRVLTSDYLANGGDKMWFFKDKEQIKVGIKLRDAIINHCNNLDTINAHLDNRLIIGEKE